MKKAMEVVVPLIFLALSIMLPLGACNRNPRYKCTASADEKCPSDKWGQELMEYNALADKYQPPTPSREDVVKMKGLLKDLQDQAPDMIKEQKIPADFILDTKRGVFTKPKQLVAPTQPGTGTVTK